VDKKLSDILKIARLPAIFAAVALLNGCASTREIDDQNVDLLVAEFQNGTLQLEHASNPAWHTAQAAAKYVPAINSGNWTEVAKLMIKTDESNDMTWFLLGESAIYLGYPQAGQKYLRNSIAASVKFCADGPGYFPLICAGAHLPDDAFRGLAALERRRGH
jgi:hypothetical protein